MKNNIIVTTDFSEGSANALNYACGLAKDHELGIVITRIYTIPDGYAGEGLSLASVDEGIQADRDRLTALLADARNSYPGVDIDGKLVVGNFLGSLSGLSGELHPNVIIMGAIGEYSDLLNWDDDWLNALINISCPVLIIPQHIRYSPIKNIAFACDYKSVCTPSQIAAIKNLVKITQANFYLVHVTPVIDAGEPQHIAAYREVFGDLNPVFETVENKQVIKGVADFVPAHDIDLLIVIPRTHGLWYSLFNKSYTRQLAKLNNLPVMALHEDN
jgi:hypothetical protein